MSTQYYCKTCNRTMDADSFYTSKRLDKYPDDGKLPECKKCVTRHVDNWNPDTFTWILEEIDVPYIEEEWNSLLEKYGQDPAKLTGMTILGRYLSKMKLNQWNKKTWADTEILRQEAEQRKRDIMERQGYNEDQIEEAISANPLSAKKPEGLMETHGEEHPVTLDAFEPVGFEDDLTDEDKTYLAIKWGRTYKTYEWIQLEKYYQEMYESFDIQTPSHEDYLKLICKTSLKMHQLIDLGDVEGFQKMSKVYDTLMKSAKFTAVQNKAESGEYMNSISELVQLCEKEEGFIPRFYTDKPKDRVDETLNDLRNYTHTLVTEEMGLGNLIESAVKALQIESEREEDEDIDDDDDIDFNDLDELKDNDFEEYYDMIEEESEIDAQYFAQLQGDEDE